MDGILEEAGAVFSGAGIIQEEEEEPVSPLPPRAHARDEVLLLENEFNGILDQRAPARNPRMRDELVHLEDAHRMFEQELLNLGIGFEDLEEQQSIINSLQQGGAEQQRCASHAGGHGSEAGRNSQSVEELLNGLLQNCHDVP